MFILSIPAYQLGSSLGQWKLKISCSVKHIEGISSPKDHVYNAEVNENVEIYFGKSKTWIHVLAVMWTITIGQSALILTFIC